MNATAMEDLLRAAELREIVESPDPRLAAILRLADEIAAAIEADETLSEAAAWEWLVVNSTRD